MPSITLFRRAMPLQGRTPLRGVPCVESLAVVVVDQTHDIPGSPELVQQPRALAEVRIPAAALGGNHIGVPIAAPLSVPPLASHYCCVSRRKAALANDSANGAKRAGHTRRRRKNRAPNARPARSRRRSCRPSTRLSNTGLPSTERHRVELDYLELDVEPRAGSAGVARCCERQLRRAAISLHLRHASRRKTTSAYSNGLSP